MHPEDLWVIIERQLLNELLDLWELEVLRRVVFTVGGEVELLANDPLVEVLEEDGQDEALVLIIGNTTTVIDDGDQVDQSLEGDAGLLLQVHLITLCQSNTGIALTLSCF